MKRIQELLVSLSTLALLFAVACGPRRPANEKRYPLKGKVIAVNKTERTATIKHEDIPGYMPGMTMPFKIKNDADLEMLKAGDEVSLEFAEPLYFDHAGNQVFADGLRGHV